MSDFFISYLPVRAHSATDETAFVICNKDDASTYLILNGDYRAQYRQCKTIAEGIAVFEKNRDSKSVWSDDISDIKDKKEKI